MCGTPFPAGVLGGVVPPQDHDALKRAKATRQQVGLSRNKRALNVQGAFRVPDHGRAQVAGRRLVLVDDVLTSGATVDACAVCCARAQRTSTCSCWRGL